MVSVPTSHAVMAAALDHLDPVKESILTQRVQMRVQVQMRPRVVPDERSVTIRKPQVLFP